LREISFLHAADWPAFRLAVGLSDVGLFPPITWLSWSDVGSSQGGDLSPNLFSFYIDDLINERRLSGHGIYVGMVFVGCILYADDIVLLSGSCFGLRKKMVDICSNYGDRFERPL